MKKIATILFLSYSLMSLGQGPIIEATYLPVIGTAINEIWDITSTNIMVPDTGQNKSWNYSGQFANATLPYTIKTFHPDTLVNGLSFSQYFPEATHASFLRSPLNDLTDSLYSYYVIDAEGLHMLGGFSIKAQTATNAGYDTITKITPSELLTPASVAYGMVGNDVTTATTYGRYNNFPIKIKRTKTKVMKGVGYGTLTMPDGTIYNNVVLGQQSIHLVDSIFAAGSNAFMSLFPSDYIEYSFLRNNTFGSSYLMYLNANSGNTLINFGWYSLPVDFGSISGTVYDSLNENNLVINGEAYLYRENSNFSKDDILAKTDLTTLGTYKFDSIPFGQYRVSIRPTGYPTALTTYYGDSINGNSAPIINTADSASTGIPDSTSIGNNIHLQYHTDSVGTGQISGSLDLNYAFGITGSPNLGTGNREVIPGVDIIVRKKPGGIAMREVKTDVDGVFSLNNLSDGNYDLFVDIPGLLMGGTYEFTITGSTLVNELCFISGKDSIHPICEQTGSVHEPFKGNDNLMDVYPNPYFSSATIKMNITEKSDVLLEVYNVLGEKVQILDKGQKQAGIYSYNFSAKSINGSSGVYIVKLTAGNKVSVVKIIEQ